MFADFHVRFGISDGVGCQGCHSRGMDEICFTAHVDYGVKQDWDYGEPILYRGEEPLAHVD